MAIQFVAGKKILGLSTDTKPTTPQDGSIFEETDTKNIYRYDAPPTPIAPTWNGSNDGWVQSGNAFVLDTTTDNRIETIATTTDTGSDAVYYDLGAGTDVSEDDWVLEFSVRHTGTQSSSTSLVIGFASSIAWGSNFGGTGDFMGIRQYLSNQAYGSYSLLGSSGGSVGNVLLGLGSGGIYQYGSLHYCRVTYTNSTGEIKFQAWSDSAKTNLLETNTGTISSSAVSNLRYLMIGSGYWSSAKYFRADNYWKDFRFLAGYTSIPSSGTYTLIKTDDIEDGAVTLTQLSTTAKTETIGIVCSDETTALEVGTGKVKFRMPYAFTLTGVRASLTTAGSTSGTTTIDINEGGTSIFSTVLTIDAGELTSTTASTPSVLSDTSIADDAEISVDIDAVSGGATETGLKVYLIGYKS